MKALIYPKWTDYAVGFFCLALWIALFSAGLLVDSKTYREHLSKSFDWFDFVASAYLYQCCHIDMPFWRTTWCVKQFDISVDSNESGSSDPPEGEANPRDHVSIAYRVESPVASMCRSFFVYLLYIAGLAIGIPGAVGDQPPGHTTFDQYLRMSGLLSLLGFAVGYDPTLSGHS